MKDAPSTQPQTSTSPTRPPETGFSPWQRLKSKRISYLTVPLLIMATVTEFVILATGWKYQKTVCLPSGMGVTFFGIGPIGATILAVELLKLPLAIWTASRQGWQKRGMLVIGLPLICLLTFQLVKDMAVYEMGIAMTPASQMLEKAVAEDTRAAQLNGELAAIEQKKADRERKLAELSAKQAQAKAGLEQLLKHNDESRTDAINLTDYQKKELSEVEARKANLVRQFNADAEQVNRALAELRGQRETELARAGKWNAEEARIENAYKARLADYTNQKTAYERNKAAYDNAGFLRREFMKQPVDPGVAPEREANTILKPLALAEIEGRIRSKETELQQINSKRRDQVAQVDADARRVREEFDHRSTAKRGEADRKRDELLAAQAALAAQSQAEQKAIDQELAASVQKVDGIRAELATARKNAVEAYEAREAAIRKTQVHRIATTVEIVRAMIMGERPATITATAKERGDILTDQISMVRIWVYPVLAFIVAFLPTLLVEIGFSTVFQPEQAQRPAHRLGFFGQRLHWLYTRAGRQKILRAERLAREASAGLSARDRALTEAKAAADKTVAEKEAELQAARADFAAAAARHKDQVRRIAEEHGARLKSREEEWVAKLAGMADSLNRSIIEKDALRDLQKSEVERQIQMRQNAWSDRLTQLRQELDAQRAGFETERTAMMQSQQQKLLEVTEDSKTQLAQARRQAADAELAAVEATAKLTNEMKAALQARDLAQSRLQQQTESFSLTLSQSVEEAARELEKAVRQEKIRSERREADLEKTLRQRGEELEHQMKQREHELTLSFDTRLREVQSRMEQEARRRELELTRQFEARSAEVEARWQQDMHKREEGAENRLRQREEQLRAQAEVRLAEAQTQADQQMRRLRSELERQFQAQSSEAASRWQEELRQQELALQTQMKQREQEWSLAAEAREVEWRNQWRADLRKREEELERQADSRVQAAQSRLAHEAQQKEELFESKSRQREEQWQAKLDAAQTELKAQTGELLRDREAASEASLRELGARMRKEMQEKDAAAQVKAAQREQELAVQWEKESEHKVRAAVEPLKTLLARTMNERDEARQALSDHARQLHAVEKKLTETSLFFRSWKDGGSNGHAHNEELAGVV